MAKHSDLKKLPVKRKDIPKIYTKRKKIDKLPLLNTFLILGIYALLLKDHIINLIK